MNLQEFQTVFRLVILFFIFVKVELLFCGNVLQTFPIKLYSELHHGTVVTLTLTLIKTDIMFTAIGSAQAASFQ